MMSEEDLLAGAQADINEMDQALLSDGQEMKSDFKGEEFEDDLYDAAIEPSRGTERRGDSVDSSSRTDSNSNTGQPQTSNTASTNVPSAPSRRFQLYVGNLTWWTTDEDIIKTIESYGITDVLEIKFAENRQNGQSRGYATIVVGSEQSGKTLMDKLPGRQLHGNLVSVLPFNKTSQQRLEEATKSSAPQEKKDDKSSIPNLGTVRIGPRTQMSNMNRPMQMGPINGMMPMGYMPMGQNMMMQPSSIMGGPAVQQPFQPQAVSNVSAAQAMNSLFRNQQSSNPLPPGTMIAPGAHVNPQVYPQFGHPQQRSDISPAEYNEIMTRNKSVSSSAITRAMNDAAEGDISSAISTLNTAINLIRQSKVSNDEACRGLIRTLEEALSSVESKSDSSRKHRRRSRSRSRSRERSSRHKHSSHKRSRAY